MTLPKISDIEELRQCPFCGSALKTICLNEGWAECSQCEIIHEITNWNAAYCWKEIDRLKEALRKIASLETCTLSDVAKDALGEKQ